MSFILPALGAATPLVVWWLGQNHQRQQQRRRIFTILNAELATNQRIIQQGLASMDLLLRNAPGVAQDENITAEEHLSLAPMFNTSFQMVAENDLLRFLPAEIITALYDYYGVVARTNWLISRVQTFRLRRPILEAIQSALNDARAAQERIQEQITLQVAKAA